MTDAATILDDVISLIGADAAKLRTVVTGPDGKPTRVLTGEEARILAGYARALVDVGRARRAAEEDGLTAEEEAALEKLSKDPRVRELLAKAGVET